MDGSALSIAEEVRSGQLSATDAVEVALEAIARLNGAVNAFVEVRPESARRDAAEVDARIAAGDEPGILAGVPVAVKDVLWEAGRDATAGSRSLLGFRPLVTSIVVERLVRAGAVVVGRTNLPEFCYRGHCANDVYGVTSNPSDLTRTPGGSSGGSAAAVAAGMVPIAIGTDGGGSIRIPASFCGVVGFKPTFGVVPREPGWPGWYTLNHLGPITATVDDARLTMQAIAGPDSRDPTTVPVSTGSFAHTQGLVGDLRGLRIAYSEDLGYVRIDDGVRQAFRSAIERFAALGADLVPAHPPVANPIDMWNTLAFTDNVASEGHLVDTGRLSEDTRSMIEHGRTVSGSEYAKARNAQFAFAATWHSFMEQYDLLLTPAMECVAFSHGAMGPAMVGGEAIGGVGDDWCHFCYPFNLTGQPALSVPIPPSDASLPIGLQIVGRRFQDALVLRAAAAWERLSPWPATVVRQPALQPSQASLSHLGAAIRAGGSKINVEGAAPMFAGQRIELNHAVVRIRRAYSPADGLSTVEFETDPAASTTLHDPAE